LDIVEGSAPAETEKDVAHGVRNVGTPATLDILAPTVAMEEDRKRLMFVHLD
jgi:hypothetical protein